MSTKIHYGYKLPNIKTLDQLEKLREQLINQAKIIKTKIATQLALRASIHMLDLYKVGFDVPDIEQTVFAYGYHKVSDRFRKFKAEPYRDPFYDLRFEIVLFLRDPLLAIFIGENKAMRGIFEKHPEVEYYGYWNNSDPEEGVSDEEWEQRRIDWEFLDGPICNQGMIIAVDDMSHFYTDEQSYSQSELQDWDFRCRETAKTIILHKVDQKEIVIPNLPDPKEHIGEYATTISDWCQKGDGDILIKEEMKQVALCINRTLTYKDLYKTKFKEFSQTNRLE